MKVAHTIEHLAIKVTPSAVDLSVKRVVTPFFDANTNTISYVVGDPDSSACAVIDSVMDFDYAAGRITYRSADAVIAFIRDHDLCLEWLIETHVHTDHLSGAPYIRKSLGGKRHYGEKALTTVRCIKLAQKLGLSLKASPTVRRAQHGTEFCHSLRHTGETKLAALATEAAEIIR